MKVNMAVILPPSLLIASSQVLKSSSTQHSGLPQQIHVVNSRGDQSVTQELDGEKIAKYLNTD